MCEFINLATGTFLIFLVLAKWHLPFSTKKMAKTEHSNLLVSLISSAADVIDLVEYVNNGHIVKEVGINVLYAVTSISLIQFCMTLTATKRMSDQNTGMSLLIDFVFGSEVWAIVFVLVTQDLPYLIVRILIVTRLSLYVSATLYFFVLKNIALCILDVYRIERIIRAIYAKKKNKIAEGRSNS